MVPGDVMPQVYLVTGGLGFLGAPLCRALVAAGHRVKVLDNASRGSERRLGQLRDEIELIHGDVRNAEVVYQALRGVDVVCHLASVNGTQYFYEKPAEVLEVGVKGIINVVEGCLKMGVGELFLASSSEVYQTPPTIPTDETVPLVIPDPFNPRYSYAGAKIISELIAIHYGRRQFRRVVIFRPHNVFGPDMGFEHVIPQLTVRLLEAPTSTDGEVSLQIQGTGAQRRAFIYVDDFIAGLMQLLARGEHEQIYHIGTREEIAIGVVAEKIACRLGVRVRLVPGPEAPGSTPRRCPDIRKLERLGFRARISFDEGLQRTVEWYAAQHRMRRPVHATTPS